MDYTVLSLFAGAGGLDLGFHRAGFTTVWANEWNKDAAQTWKNAMGDAMHHGDLVEFMKDGLPPAGSADVVIGGPPCQGFSLAGKMNAKDPRSKHVYNFLTVVNRIRPKAFLMENVAALSDNPRWAGTKHDLLSITSELGYKPYITVLNSAHYETPQRRRRMFLVGVLPDMYFRFPEPVTKDNPPTVKQAFAELPRFGEPGNDWKCNAVFTPMKKPVIDAIPYRAFLYNGNTRLLDPNAPSPTVTASMGGALTPFMDQKQFDEGGEPWFAWYIEHLRNGGNPMVPPAYVRRITVQEAAAIQTFPKDMPWAGSMSARWRQIGNAVPPNLAYHLALAVKAALDGTTKLEEHPLFHPV